MKRPIIQDLNILRQKSEPCRPEEVKDILQDLEDSLDLKKGIGLAGVQIGALKQIAIIRIGTQKINLVNAYIISKNEKFRMQGEGCLSLKGIHVDTIRYNDITINNNGTIETYTGLLSVAIQHELGHFFGKLIIDKGIIWRNVK